MHGHKNGKGRRWSPCLGYLACIRVVLRDEDVVPPVKGRTRGSLLGFNHSPAMAAALRYTKPNAIISITVLLLILSAPHSQAGWNYTQTRIQGHPRNKGEQGLNGQAGQAQRIMLPPPAELQSAGIN